MVLVGWSLGGFIAREYAREHPQHVRQVITLGSPVIGGPRYTATARWYASQGFDLDELEQAVAARYANPLTVPITAIYSRRDGVVAWRNTRGVADANAARRELGAALSRVLAIDELAPAQVTR